MIISNSEGRWAKQHEFPGGILSFLITYGATLLEINYSVLQNPYIISIRIKRAKQNSLVSRSWLLLLKQWKVTHTYYSLFHWKKIQNLLCSKMSI